MILLQFSNCLVRAGRYYPSVARTPAYYHWLSSETGVIAYLNRRKKRVHVDMQNHRLKRYRYSTHILLITQFVLRSSYDS
jgi:hypothetical protein